MGRCDHALIIDHMPLLQEEFQKMLDADRNEGELLSCFRLLVAHAYLVQTSLESGHFWREFLKV